VPTQVIIEADLRGSSRIYVACICVNPRLNI
jgi:hypothetical protein